MSTKPFVFTELSASAALFPLCCSLSLLCPCLVCLLNLPSPVSMSTEPSVSTKPFVSTEHSVYAEFSVTTYPCVSFKPSVSTVHCVSTVHSESTVLSVCRSFFEHKCNVHTSS